MRNISISVLMTLCFVAGIAFVYSCGSGGGSSSTAATTGELEIAINALETRVAALENKLTPAYDSGWLDIALEETLILDHGLSGNVGDYIVDVQQWASSSMEAPFAPNINNITSINLEGVRWKISADGDGTPFVDSNNIWIYREFQDTHANKIRIRIWKINI